MVVVQQSSSDWLQGFENIYSRSPSWYNLLRPSLFATVWATFGWWLGGLRLGGAIGWGVNTCDSVGQILWATWWDWYGRFIWEVLYGSNWWEITRYGRLLWEICMRDFVWEITTGHLYGRFVWGDLCGSERLGERRASGRAIGWATWWETEICMGNLVVLNLGGD